MAEHWMRCMATPGQFPGEFAITGETSNGTVFSFFMPEERVTVEQPPAEGHPEAAWVRVQVIEERGGLYIIRLPRQTLENGQFVTVKPGQLQHAPGRQDEAE
jgi:hypothetical protein